MVAAIGAYVMKYIVVKAKKVLDFSVTRFIIHLIICSSIYQFPTSWLWWVINIINVILETCIGEYFCLQEELKEIKIGEVYHV